MKITGEFGIKRTQNGQEEVCRAVPTWAGCRLVWNRISRDSELNSYWGTICTPLVMETAGGIQKVNCDAKNAIRSFLFGDKRS